MRLIKIAFAAAALLFASRALAAWNFLNNSTAYLTQACASGTVPTTATDGLPLTNVAGFVVVVEAENTRTLSGAGQANAYVFDGAIGAWIRHPAADVAVTATGVRRMMIYPGIVYAPRGRIAYVTDGVTVSGGTNCTVYILAAYYTK